MPPKAVFIIRHAEKPFDPDDPRLTLRGRIRAAAYSVFFDRKRNADFPAVDRVVAAANSKAGRRAVQTVKPLAAALGLEIGQDYAAKDVAELANFLLHDPSVTGETVLVCWHHERIGALAEALVS